MTLRYHVSDDGVARRCSAQIQCTVRNNHAEAPHGEFASEEEAQKWAETVEAKRWEGSFAPVHRKIPSEAEVNEDENINRIVNEYHEDFAQIFGSNSPLDSSNVLYALDEDPEFIVRDYDEDEALEISKELKELAENNPKDKRLGELSSQFAEQVQSLYEDDAWNSDEENDDYYKERLESW